MLADRASGRCIATSSWESEDATARAAPTACARCGMEPSELWAPAPAPSTPWEVAVVHRDHAMPDGACARLTWMSGMGDEPTVPSDVFRMAVLPRVQELDGFCSASLLISRETGRAVGTVTFERREQLEASRDAAAGIREAVREHAERLSTTWQSSTWPSRRLATSPRWRDADSPDCAVRRLPPSEGLKVGADPTSAAPLGVGPVSPLGGCLGHFAAPWW